MATTRFSLGELAKLDMGRVREQFDQSVAGLLTDLINRPWVETARSVSLQVRISPGSLSAGPKPMLETVDLEFQITSKIPVKARGPYNMLVGGTEAAPALIFNHESPDDPKQQTIDDELHRGKKGGERND